MLLVVDASVAIKWVIGEPDSADAAAIRRFDLIAPELILSECCNALWKAAQRSSLSLSDALQRMAHLTAAPVTIVPARNLAERALEMAIALGHPAYDTLYLAIAEARQCRVVTADSRLLRKVASGAFSYLVIGLQTAASN